MANRFELIEWKDCVLNSCVEARKENASGRTKASRSRALTVLAGCFSDRLSKAFVEVTLVAVAELIRDLSDGELRVMEEGHRVSEADVIDVGGESHARHSSKDSSKLGLAETGHLRCRRDRNSLSVVLPNVIEDGLEPSGVDLMAFELRIPRIRLSSECGDEMVQKHKKPGFATGLGGGLIFSLKVGFNEILQGLVNRGSLGRGV